MTDKPESGEVAALIERLRDWVKVPDPAFAGWNTVIDDLTEAADALARLSAPVPDPIPMVLHCPQCSRQHIDAPQPEKDWTNPPHRSHECQFCGHVWRPADVATTGVQATQTHGSRDAAPVPEQPRIKPHSLDWFDPEDARTKSAAQINPRVTTNDAQDWAVVLRDRFPISDVQRELIAQCLESLAAPVPAREWVPVGERLPRLGESALVYVPKHGGIQIDEWDTIMESPVAWGDAAVPVGEGWVNHDACGLVTHWMPLPPPPAADK